MRLLKIIFLSLALVVFGACTIKKPALDKKSMIIKSILTSTAKSIESQKGLKCRGYFSSAMYEVEELGLSFATSSQLNIESSRDLLIELADVLIENVNASKEIEPYLGKNGFDIKNVDLSIFINANNTTSLAPDLGVVLLKSGQIRYKTYDKEIYEARGIPKTTTVFSETYQEALTTLEKQQLDTI